MSPHATTNTPGTNTSPLLAVLYRFRAGLSNVPLALTLAAGLCASAFGQSASTPQADRILIEKSQHRMTLYAHGKVLKVYRVSLGRGTGAPKQERGDHETPEGFYTIDSLNQHSKYHLALHVSYPNAADRARARRDHVDTGGDIMIHGLPPGYAWLSSAQNIADWTDGCIALTNAEMDEVWKLVPVGTPVEIRH